MRAMLGLSACPAPDQENRGEFWWYLSGHVSVSVALDLAELGADAKSGAVIQEKCRLTAYGRQDEFDLRPQQQSLDLHQPIAQRQLSVVRAANTTYPRSVSR